MRLNNIFFITVISLFIISFNSLIFSKEKSPKINNSEVTLDLDTAVSLALANNLGLKAERINFSSDKWNMVTSWNTFLPTVTMGATLVRSNLDDDNRNQTVTGATFVKDGTEIIPGSYSAAFPYSTEIEIPRYSVAASFDLTLNLNAAMVFSVYQTVLDWKSGKIDLESAKKGLVRDVKKSIYNLILMKKNIEVMEDSLDNAKKRYEQAVINYNNGLVSDYTKLSAQVAYENMKPSLIEMVSGYNTSLLDFKNMIGLKKSVKIIFDAKIESEKKEFNSEELINKYIKENLSIKSLDLSIKSLINARNTFISQLTPSISIMYSMDPTFQQDALTENWFGDADYMEDNWKQNSGMFAFAVSLPISSWVPFSSTQMKIATYQFSIQNAKIGLEQAKQGTELQIDTLVMNLKKSMHSIESLKLNIELAQKAYNKAEEAYNAGSKEILEVQNSEIELKKAKLNLLQEEYNYTTNLLELEYVINSTL